MVFLRPCSIISSKVEAKDYMSLIKKISLKNNIDENKNILKTSKRGRKAKNQNYS